MRRSSYRQGSKACSTYAFGVDKRTVKRREQRQWTALSEHEQDEWLGLDMSDYA